MKAAPESCSAGRAGIAESLVDANFTRIAADRAQADEGRKAAIQADSACAATFTHTHSHCEPPKGLLLTLIRPVSFPPQQPQTPPPPWRFSHQLTQRSASLPTRARPTCPAFLAAPPPRPPRRATQRKATSAKMFPSRIRPKTASPKSASPRNPITWPSLAGIRRCAYTRSMGMAIR